MRNKLTLLTGGLFMGLMQLTAQAVVTATRGDLVAAFYEVNGSSAGPNTYLVKLGDASELREGGQMTTLTLGTDLSTAFGPDWATTGTMRWSILGTIGAADPTLDGDPARTTYFSGDNGGIVGAGSGFSLSSTQRGFLNTAITNLFIPLSGTGLPENGAVNGGAIYASGSPNSVSSMTTPTVTTNFGIGLVPFATLNGVDAGLDLFRTLHSTAGADLTANATPLSAVVGQSQYVGSFKLDTLGNLSLTTVPEPTSTAMLALLGLMGLTRRKRA